MTKTIYLSPSTQEHNIGVGNYGSECYRMNQIADVIEKLLKKHGVKAYRNKQGWTLEQVVVDSNARRPDVHFAIHSNAGGGRGSEVFCHRFGGDGERLARAVYEQLSPLTPTGDRGVKEGYNFFGSGVHMYELAKTTAPAALVEIAFHDDPNDAQWLISHIEAIGTCLAKGMLNYFNIPYVDDSPDLASEVKTLQEFGIIRSPEYWEQNATKGKTVAGEYAAILIRRVAAFLRFVS